MDQDPMEEGRRLASEREALIARGVDPTRLAVPLAPPTLADHAARLGVAPGQLPDPPLPAHVNGWWGIARDGVRAMLHLAGEDPDRPGLIDTPERVLRAWLELTDRPGDPEQLMARVFTDCDAPTDEMVAVGPIDFTSVCEHHLLPFTGQAWVAYVPEGDRVVGLSKLARLVEHYAKRPQVQERLTTQIVDALTTHLRPRGAGCILRATHTCMSLRGVRKVNAVMTTSKLAGDFHTDPAMRAEFLALTRS